jgi:glycosyltransferase involved in cell wall biosynthesis
MTERNEHHAFKADEIPCQDISDPAVLSKNPLVRVNMITYNHEPYIAQAIEGVLMQETDFPIELIIGEDCSTDRTREIVLDYQKKHPDIIRVVTSEHNVGMTKNDLRTNKACRGKYIALCEGDDYWFDPHKLRKQVNFLATNPDYGLVHSDFDKYYESNKVLERAFNRSNAIKIPEGNIFNYLLGNEWIIHTPTTMVRNNLQKKYLKFYADNKSETKKWKFGDIASFLYFARFSKIKYLDEPTAVYRILEESACNTKSEKKRIEKDVALQILKLFYAQNFHASENIIHDLYVRLNQALLKKAFIFDNFILAKKSFCYLMKNGKIRIKDVFFFICSITILNNWVKKILGPLRISQRDFNQ